MPLFTFHSYAQLCVQRECILLTLQRDGHSSTCVGSGGTLEAWKPQCRGALAISTQEVKKGGAWAGWGEHTQRWTAKHLLWQTQLWVFSWTSKTPSATGSWLCPRWCVHTSNDSCTHATEKGRHMLAQFFGAFFFFFNLRAEQGLRWGNGEAEKMRGWWDPSGPS